MNSKITLLAIIEILSAISIGVFILALTYRLLKYIGRKRFGIEAGNLATSIFVASVLFSIGYMVSGVIDPLTSLFRLLAAKDAGTFSLALSFIGTGAFYIALAFVSGVLIVFLSVILYTSITPLDEFAEIRNNNIGVALIVGTITITLSLLTHDGVSLLVESFIPYPDQFPK
ncbi:MAG TPA: DUF350 domain-containing protein [Cyclobacteriaceae bacterium]|nr:DUF350 domain-containing protein [Cyclobacteriaceae bacterium]